jgi:predicted nucleotidyltransferase
VSRFRRFATGHDVGRSACCENGDEVTDQTSLVVVDGEGERVLADAVEAYRVALGGRLVAAYALGSLAHGGFSELVSDIDLGLIISDPPLPADASMIQVVADAEKSRGSALHERLSVFWGTPATLRGEREGGRFPALDRLDLIENGRLLVGADDARAGLLRPGVRELIVTGAEFALDYLAGLRRLPGASAQAALKRREGAIEEILCPEVLIAAGVRRLTKLVLFPVRFLYTAATGRVGTNDAAAAWYLIDRKGPSSGLVAAALEWRTVPPADEANAALLLREHMLPLYIRYIEDHIARLDGLGEVELARAFQEWRDRLVR